MSGFLGRILSPDNRLADTLMAVSENPNTSRMGLTGLAAIDQRQAAEQEAEKEALGIAQKIKMKVLDTSLQALQRPDITEEQRAAIADDVMKLGDDLGVDVSPYLNIPAAASEPMKVGGSLVEKTPEGFKTVYKDESRAANQNRPVVLSPGAQVVDPATGKVLQENPNPRFAPPRPERQTATSFKLGRSERAQEKLTKAAEQANSGSLEDQLKYAYASIEAKQADDIYGVGEGRALREKLGGSADALRNYDRQYAKAIEILDKNPTAATVAGDTAKAIEGAGANVLGLISLIPGVDNTLTTAMEDYADELSAVAGDSAELKSVIFSLAVQNAIAKGLADGRMSNQDIEFAIEDIGSRTRSPKAIKRRLAEIRSQVASNLRDRIDTTIENFSGLSEADPVQGPTSRIDALRKKYGR